MPCAADPQTMAVSPAPVRPAAASGDDTKPTALAKSKPDVRAAKSKAESPKVETKAEPKAEPPKMPSEATLPMPNTAPPFPPLPTLH